MLVMSEGMFVRLSWPWVSLLIYIFWLLLTCGISGRPQSINLSKAVTLRLTLPNRWAQELVAVQSVLLLFSLQDGRNISLIQKHITANFLSSNTYDRYRTSTVLQPCNYAALSLSVPFLLWCQVVVLHHHLNAEDTNLSGDNNHRQKSWLVMDFYMEVSRVLPANARKAQH